MCSIYFFLLQREVLNEDPKLAGFLKFFLY